MPHSQQLQYLRQLGQRTAHARRLAVVFGTFNRFRALQNAVASVRQAAGKLPHMMIIVDGGSTDGSREWLAQQADVVMLGQRGPLTGAVRAFNLGFSYAVEHHFDYIAHLNDDAEIVTENGLEQAVSLLEGDPTIGEVAFAFDLYGDWRFDHVNGKPYANFGVVRREAGMDVARAQGDPSGRLWWNPIYRTYGADSEFGVWLWKLGWKVHTAEQIRVHDLQIMDDLRTNNDALNPDRSDSKIFWNRWKDETFATRELPSETLAAKDFRKVVLVTGGDGFLGQHLRRELAQDADVVLLQSRRAQNDLRDAGATLRLFRATRPDVVYHLAAACGGIGANQRTPATFCRDNLLMGINVLDAALACHVRKTVLVGTVCAYPKFTPVPFRVEDLWNGYPEETNAPYGIAKRTISLLGETYRQQHGLNVVTAILANLYGPGDNFDLETSHVIPALIRKFMEAVSAKAATVTLWGDGSPTREFLHVRDAARALRVVAQRYEQPGPINIGSGREISIVVLANMIAKLVGFGGRVEWDPSRPNGQPRRSLDIGPATALGVEAGTTLDVGLEETITWFRSFLHAVRT